MGSAQLSTINPESERLLELAERLGWAVAERGCVLVTGATSGYPAVVSRAARSRKGLTIGISPASTLDEHVSRYALPEDAADTIIYTGFGLKGRNVINIRSSDVVIIFGGGIGTLNELTIAWDEGKVVGVLEGTGGVTNQVEAILSLESRRKDSNIGESSLLQRDANPELLVDACLQAWHRQNT